MQELTNKADQVRLWQLGAFGNKLRTWSTPSCVPDIRQRCVSRSRDLALRAKRPGGIFRPHLTWDEVDRLWTADFYVCEMAPHENEIVQGEIFRDVGGLHFYYTFVKEPMRVAMRDHPDKWLRATGYAVDLFLQHLMSPESWIELNDCLDLDPDVVVEFTVFDCFVGDRPGRNAIIWECRKGY